MKDRNTDPFIETEGPGVKGIGTLLPQSKVAKRKRPVENSWTLRKDEKSRRR